MQVFWNKKECVWLKICPIWVKVWTFWERHKIWKNLPLKIWRYWVTSNWKWKIFSNFVSFSERPNFTTYNLTSLQEISQTFRFWSESNDRWRNDQFNVYWYAKVYGFDALFEYDMGQPIANCLGRLQLVANSRPGIFSWWVH